MRASTTVQGLFPFLIVVALLACRPPSIAEDGLDKARRLTEEGNYEEALQEHISFHNNILKTQPAMYGVRLSFALSDWIDLGRKYPKALTALKEIRNAKTARLIGGENDRPLFHDVESINDHLDEEDATVTLFKTIAAKDEAFARKIYDLADEALVEKREFKMAKQFMGDPATIFESAKTGYERGMQYAKTGPQKSASEGAFRKIFAGKIVRLLLILQNTGDQERAHQIQAEALKIVADDRIKNALKP